MECEQVAADGITLAEYGAVPDGLLLWVVAHSFFFLHET